MFVAADRAAWEAVPLRSASGAGATRAVVHRTAGAVWNWSTGFATLRKPVQSPGPTGARGSVRDGAVLGQRCARNQRHHAVLASGPWAAAVAVVDALSWGDADDGLVGRWDDLPEWPQMFLRAVMFRLAVHALHPRSTADAFPGLARTSDIVRLLLVRFCGAGAEVRDQALEQFAAAFEAATVFPSTTALTRRRARDGIFAVDRCDVDRSLDDREQRVVELQVDLVVAGRDDGSVQGDVRGGGSVDVTDLFTMTRCELRVAPVCAMSSSVRVVRRRGRPR